MMSTKQNLWHQTEALVRAGEIEPATEDARHYTELTGGSPRYRLPYLRAQAVLAQASGEITVAATYLEEAAALAGEIGLPGELWPVLAALGELYRKQGDPTQASLLFKQAAKIVRELATNLDETQRTRFLAAGPVQQLLAY